jgi:O-antigen/teichoic acid export membrane protein
LPERILLPSSLLLLVAAYAAFAGAAPDAVAAMATAGIVGLVGCLLCGAMILRLLPDPARRAKAEYRPREWLRVSLPMLVISGSSVLYRRLDVIMVGLLLGPAAAGIMAVAVRLANLVSLGLAATNPMVSTIVAENHATGRLDRLQTSLRFASLLTVALTAGIAAPLILLGDDLLGVFGEQFRTAYVALVILTAGQIVNALTGSVNAVLTMTGHQDRVAIIMLASAALNALLNIPLVLHYGVLGGAIASAVAVTLKNLAMLVAARRQLGIDPSIAAAFSGRRKLAVG